MDTCPGCQRPIVWTSVTLHCGHCGRRLASPCGICGTPGPLEHLFCQRCGASREAGTAPQPHAGGALAPIEPDPEKRIDPERQKMLERARSTGEGLDAEENEDPRRPLSQDELDSLFDD